MAIQNFSRTRLTAMVLTIGLVAAACGGSDTAELDAAQERIDELREQVDELSSAQEAAATTTTTVANVEPSADTEPVGDVPAEDPAEDDEVVAEDAPVEEDTTEEPADDSADTVAAAAVDGLAVANGPIIDASMGPDELATFFDDLIGPTDDVAATMARIDWRWPALTPLPDSVIGDVTTLVEWDEFNELHKQRTGVEFTTSAGAQDVLLAYQTQLASVIPDAAVSTSTRTDDGRITYFASVEQWSLATTELDNGDAVVSITHESGSAIPASDGVFGALDGLISGTFGEPEGSIVERIRVYNFGGGPTFQLQYDFPGAVEAEVIAVAAAKAQENGWTVDRETEWGVVYLAPETSSENVTTSTQELGSGEEYQSSVIRVEFEY